MTTPTGPLTDRTTNRATVVVPRIAVIEQVMGLPVSIYVRGPRARGPVVAEAIHRAMDILRSADLMFSTYRVDSQISRIDRGELALEDADPLVREVCELAADAERLTGGIFRIRLPDADGRIRFDPSGLVKGWAVERAGRELERLPDHDFLVNAGGDVVVGGLAEGTPAWRIGVEAPGRRGLLGFVELRRGAVATSGTAARGLHLWDPTIGEPARGLLAATVTGPSLMRADMLATAAFVRGEGAVAWVPRLDSACRALVVRRDGSVATSAGFPLNDLAG
jgi:thiamine biosynthesis lipoprotein